MKKGLDKVQKSLLVLIGVLSIVLASVLIFKGYRLYLDKKQEKEWAARHQEVQQEVDSVRVQIEELAGDAEALQIFLDEQVNSVLVLDEWQSGEQEGQDAVNGESGMETGGNAEDLQAQENAGGSQPQESTGSSEPQENAGGSQAQEDSGETGNRGDEQGTGSQGSADGPDGGKDPALEVSSGAIVIGAEEAGQEGQAEQPAVSTGQPEGEGTAETGADMPAEEVDQQGLDAAADGAIIIDAPPAPKPPAEKPETADGAASSEGDTVSGNGKDKDMEEEEDTVSMNGIPAEAEEEEEDTVSMNGMPAEGEEDTVSMNGMPAEAEEEKEDTVSMNGTPAEAEEEEDGTVSANGVSEEGESGNTAGITEEAGMASGNVAGADTISGNAVVDGQVIPYVRNEPEMTLEERRKICSSYMETVQTNGEDKAVIDSSSYDFSDVKIACLGDSITEGSNLDKMENYQQYSYPSVLKNILQAEEVYNLGVGGSSYGRYWDNAFVDRYKEIPEDADIILVMGGTNDGFAASTKELGSLEEKKARTFYGDVDELMRGLKKDYPNAKIIFATPLPNVLHDYLRAQRDYLLPQRVYANAVKELAAQYQIDVIDLYNSNLLDTHDAQVISNYMPDGVHGNPAGYQVLAEHMARSIIEIVQRGGLGNGQAQGTVSGNSTDGFGGGMADGAPAGGDTISGNGLNADSPLPPERTLSPEEAKRIEEERLRAEKERLEREKEEAAKAEENNKKVAEDAVVIEPVPVPGGNFPAGENPAEAMQEGHQEQDGGSRDKMPDAMDAGGEENYEYGGEAIVIQ